MSQSKNELWLRFTLSGEISEALEQCSGQEQVLQCVMYHMEQHVCTIQTRNHEIHNTELDFVLWQSTLIPVSVKMHSLINLLCYSKSVWLIAR